MCRCISLLLFIGLAWGQELANYYLLDKDNYNKIPADIKEIIESEMDKMYSDVKKDLDNILYYGYYDADAQEVVTGTYFDEDAYLTALLSIKNPSEAEAYWLKSQFMYSTTAKNTKTVLKNKKIKLDDFFASSTSISKECPSWAEIIKYVGGYSELAKSGIKKNTYEKLFTLYHNYDLVTFVEQGKCVISSKYSGNDKAFEYYKIDKDKSDKIIGEYFIEDLNYNILSGKVEPTITIQADDFSLKIDLYEVEPRTRNSLKKSFSNYDATINSMFDDLLSQHHQDMLSAEKREIEEAQKKADLRAKKIERKKSRENLQRIEKLNTEFKEYGLSSFWIKNFPQNLKGQFLENLKSKPYERYGSARVQVYYDEDHSADLIVKDLIIFDDMLTFGEIEEVRFFSGVNRNSKFKRKEDGTRTYALLNHPISSVKLVKVKKRFFWNTIHDSRPPLDDGVKQAYCMCGGMGLLAVVGTIAQIIYETTM